MPALRSGGTAAAAAPPPERRRVGRTPPPAAHQATGVARYRYLLDGLVRIFHFFRLAFPIMLHYKIKELICRFQGCSDTQLYESLEPLHSRYAPRCSEIAQKLGGFYIKAGQHMATVGVHLLPQVFVDELTTLLENCPPQPFSTVKKIVEDELGEGALSRHFDRFDERPIKAASTGQVHSARLCGGGGGGGQGGGAGHEVVVKVQYPDAEWAFRVDLFLFITAAQVMSSPEGVGILREIQHNFDTEFNYRLEAQQQREAARHMQNFPNVVVPLPVDRLHPHSPIASGMCTKNVLVMDRLYGNSLADWGKSQLQAMAQERGKTSKELRMELMSKTAEDLERMRPSELLLGAYGLAIRGVDLAFNTPLFAYNWGLGYAIGEPLEYIQTPLPPNIFQICEELLAAQGHMLFTAGFINADPHAGNVMLLEDGRIGLIDWGQVTHLTIEQRCLLANLFIAVADHDEPLIADCMRALGGYTVRGWDWTMVQWGRIACSSLTELQDLGADNILKVIGKLDRSVKEADNAFIMTFKNLLYTRQVAAVLGFPRVNSAEHLRHQAEECLRRARWPVPATTPGKVVMPPEVVAMFHTLKSDARELCGVDLQATPATLLAEGSGEALLLVAAAPALVAYTVASLLRRWEAHRALGAAALLLQFALAAPLTTRGFRRYVRSCVATRGRTPLAGFDPAQREFAHESLREAPECTRLAPSLSAKSKWGKLWSLRPGAWVALGLEDLHLPLWCVAGCLLPGLLGHLLAGPGTESQPAAPVALARALKMMSMVLVLLFNSRLVLHLAVHECCKRAAPNAIFALALALSVTTIYCTQLWVIHLIGAERWKAAPAEVCHTTTG